MILLSSTLGVRLVQAEPDDGDKQAETVEAAPAAEASDESEPVKSYKPADVDVAEAENDQPSVRPRV